MVRRVEDRSDLAAGPPRPTPPEPPPTLEEQAFLDEYEKYRGRKVSSEDLWLALVQLRAIDHLPPPQPLTRAEWELIADMERLEGRKLTPREARWYIVQARGLGDL